MKQSTSGTHSRPVVGERLAYRVVRGSLWAAASSYCNVGFGFLANVVLTRILAPEHFGIFTLGRFFFSLLNVRPKIGIGHAFVQDRETTGTLVGSHLVLDVTAGSLTLLLAAAAMPVLRLLGYSWDVIWVMLALAGVGISDSIMGTAWRLLDKELQFAQTSLVSSLVFPFSYLPAFWLALHGGGYWSLVAQNAAYALLLLFGMGWAVRRRLPHLWQLRWRFDREVAIKLVRFGATVGIASVATTLFTGFDGFLVGTFVGVAMLGFYDRACRIAEWPGLLVTRVVTRAAFYAYARLQDDPERLQKTATMTTWLITTLALPLALAIFASAPDLVALLYGERWRPSALLLRFLVIYSLLRALLENARSLFIAVGRPRIATAVAAVQAGVLMLIATPFTVVYGAVGTCIGLGIAFVVALVHTYWYGRRTASLSLRNDLGVPVFAAALAIGVTLVFVRGGDLDALPLAGRVAVEAGVVTAAFFSVMLGVQPRELMARSASVWRWLRADSGG